MDAYGLLWTRHYRAIAAFVRREFPRVDEEDVAAQAFTDTLAALRAGNGPSSNFRAYLYRSARNRAMETSKNVDHFLSGDIGDILDEAKFPPSRQPHIASHLTLHKAFSALSERHREILWYLDVEGMSPRHVAPLVGMKPNAVSVAAHRARRQLQVNWLEAHLHRPALNKECRLALSSYAAHLSYGEINARDDSHLKHVETCTDCSSSVKEALSSWKSLGAVLLPLASATTFEQLAQRWDSGITPASPASSPRAGKLYVAGAAAALLAAALVTALLWPRTTLLQGPGTGPSQAAAGSPPTPSALPHRGDSPQQKANRVSPAPDHPLETPSVPSTSPSAKPPASPSSPRESGAAPLPTGTGGRTSPGGEAELPVDEPSELTTAWRPDFESQHVSGRGVPNTTLLLWSTDVPARSAVSTPVDSAGYWSTSLPAPRAGKILFSARTVRPRDGAMSGIATFSRTLSRPSLAKPTLAFSSPSSIQIGGHTTPGQRVEVRDQRGVLIAEATSGASGDWTLSIAQFNPLASQYLHARTVAGPFASSDSEPLPIVPRFTSTYTNRSYTSFSLRGIPSARFCVATGSGGSPGTRGVLDSRGMAEARMEPISPGDAVISYCDASGATSKAAAHG